MRDLTSSKQVFMSFSNQEQREALFDMVEYVRGELANDKKEHIDIKGNVAHLQGELQGVRRRKDKADKSMTTSEKIMAVLDRRFDTWSWFRDKVLPQIVSVIIFGILYMVFGGKIP